MMTKLRPFVHTFFKEASEMFDMYIYTMGDRPYALEMARLLDPNKEYFNAKVISRDDGTQRHQKGLVALFVAGGHHQQRRLEDSLPVTSKSSKDVGPSQAVDEAVST
ncbi:hypothetical protein Ddye_021950 [Dipteronia dyeriana]|uniref:protein-serine/threonine phosphatase n=1 Tax=Dipteronia dyeriana TaxID=168575 RepID=A0AAD9WYH0_9ROSI|nr:hypothetical protein Ddye_021950 [Dipteronia dyeriana]